MVYIVSCIYIWVSTPETCSKYHRQINSIVKKPYRFKYKIFIKNCKQKNKLVNKKKQIFKNK
jgi:hypothetical protein